MYRSKSFQDTIHSFIVPALLVAVAVVQILFVEIYDLTRWKAAGFGMFSTIDSPGSRFLRVYVITDTGEIPVLIPRKLQKFSKRIRAFPSEDQLAELSNKLLHGTWVPLTMVSATQYYLNHLRAAGEDFQGTADDIQYHLKDQAPFIDFEKNKFIIMLDDNEQATSNILKINAVRVEVWKYSFNRKELYLTARKISESSAIKQ